MRRSGPSKTRNKYHHPTTLPGLRAALMCPPSVEGTLSRIRKRYAKGRGEFRTKSPTGPYGSLGTPSRSRCSSHNSRTRVTQVRSSRTGSSGCLTLAWPRALGLSRRVAGGHGGSDGDAALGASFLVPRDRPPAVAASLDNSHADTGSRVVREVTTRQRLCVGAVAGEIRSLGIGQVPLVRSHLQFVGA